MSERDNETFDLDDEFLNNAPEDGTDYDRILDRVDKRVRTQGKRGKAAWSKLEEVLADRKLERICATSSMTRGNTCGLERRRMPTPVQRPVHS
jgi:hypothetical protein